MAISTDCADLDAYVRILADTRLHLNAFLALLRQILRTLTPHCIFPTAIAMSACRLKGMVSAWHSYALSSPRSNMLLQAADTSFVSPSASMRNVASFSTLSCPST